MSVFWQMMQAEMKVLFNHIDLDVNPKHCSYDHGHNHFYSGYCICNMTSFYNGAIVWDMCVCVCVCTCTFTLIGIVIYMYSVMEKFSCSQILVWVASLAFWLGINSNIIVMNGIAFYIEILSVLIVKALIYKAFTSIGNVLETCEKKCVWRFHVLQGFRTGLRPQLLLLDSKHEDWIFNFPIYIRNEKHHVKWLVV